LACMAGIAWNISSWFWPAWNGLECRKLVLACLELLEMSEVSFDRTGMAWNEGSWVGPDGYGLELRKSIFS
jgi:hypothetical protein